MTPVVQIEEKNILRKLKPGSSLAVPEELQQELSLMEG